MSLTRPEPAELDSFEQALLTELRTVVTERSRPAAARPRRAPATTRRLRLGAAAALVAAGGAAAALTGGSPAFAVGPGADGSVVVRIHDFTDAQGLEHALAAEGVDAQVDYSGSGPAVAAGDDSGAADPSGPPPESVPGDGSLLAPTTESPDDPAATCGLTASGTPPIALEQDGNDVVITLAGPTITGDNDLRLTTHTGNGSMLVADYVYEGGTCGLMADLP